MKKVFLYYITLSLLLLSTTTAVDTSILPNLEHDDIQNSHSGELYIKHSKSSPVNNELSFGQGIEGVDKAQTITGTASRYDYDLDGYGHRSKNHATCAFHHQKKDHSMYRVCNLDNGKCVECYNNDWMRREDRLVDLSSFAFKQIGDLSRGLMNVSVEKI